MAGVKNTGTKTGRQRPSRGDDASPVAMVAAPRQAQKLKRTRTEAMSKDRDEPDIRPAVREFARQQAVAKVLKEGETPDIDDVTAGQPTSGPAGSGEGAGDE